MNQSELDYATPDPPRPFLGSAAGSVASWLRLLVPAIAGLTADLWTKNFAQHHLQDQDEFVLWPDKLIFRYTENGGAVFGLGQGKVPLFIVFSIVAIGVIGILFLRSRKNHYVLHIALGLIAAGAFGNLYDRIMYGKVRDFILMLPAYWPYIFNVADALLCVGVPLLMICWISQSDATMGN